MGAVNQAGRKLTTDTALPDYRLLFDAVPGLFAVVLPDDPDFTVVAASEAFLRAVKMSRAAFVGHGLFGLFADVRDPWKRTTLSNLKQSFLRVMATAAPDAMPAQRFDMPRDAGDGSEERHWSPMNTPVLGDHGEVRYIIHRIEDVTELVNLRRLSGEHLNDETALRGRRFAETERLRGELEDSETRFSIAFAEAPVGMVLSTPDGKILQANQAYLDMVGYSLDELRERDSTHFTHPDDIAPTRQVVRALQEGMPVSNRIEKRYIHRDGHVQWGRASMSMRRDESGHPTQLIAIIEDITEQKRAEERLRAIFDGTYAYIGLLAPDGTVLEANRALLGFSGSRIDQVVGRPFWKIPWFAGTPGASSFVKQGVLRAASGDTVRYEATLTPPGGEAATFDLSLHPIRNDKGEVVLIVPEGQDISERKHLEMRDAFLVGLDDVTRPLTDPDEVTQAAARMLGERLNVDRCAYAEVEEDQDTFNLTGNYTHGVESIVGRFTFTQFSEACLLKMRGGEPFVVSDSETDPRLDGVRESYRHTAIRAVVWVPLHKAGRFVAGMAVHQKTPREWHPREIELVQLVASRCWESIERAHVTRELREREQRFSFLAETIPQMVWTATADGMLDYVNQQGAAYFGLPESELIGAGWLSMVHPEDQQQTIERWKSSLASGHDYEAAFRLKRGSDASWRWHLVRAKAWTDEAGAVLQWFGTCTDIQDQKESEAHLRQQWQNFDTALSNTPDFAYVFDLEGRFTYVNRSLLSLWQKSLPEAVGRNFFELGYPPELAERLQRQIQEVISTRQPLRDQTPFTGPDGETRQYDYIFVPVVDGDGRVEAVGGTTRDITNQNRAAQQIAEDRRRWQELLLQTPAAIAVLRGPEHRFEWVNPDYERLVGRSAEALVGKAVVEALPEIGNQEFLDLLDRVYRTGEPFSGREVLARLNRGSGTLHDVYLNFVYLPTRDVHQQIDGIFVHVTEVTEAVEARRQIEESERQFRSLAETIPHLAWMADGTGHIFWYNQRWFEYTGTTLEEMTGWGWQKVHDPAVLPEVVDGWTRSLASGSLFEMVFPIRGASGAFRTFLTRVQPVHDHQGRVVRWFGTNTDITDQQQTEAELRRMNRELEEFAYVASHDLQEPLRMVNIYSQLILRELGSGNDRLSQYGGFVQQGVTRMETLIHDLLHFSRSGQTEELRVGAADLNVSLHEALAVLRQRLDETGAEISADRLPVVHGDTQQLAHVFQNLIANGLKYRKSALPPQIRITARQEGDQWLVAVQDNGIGFAQQYAERIFGLFKRLHNEEYPGTGLGLAICKRIVERYGGRIWAESAPGEGATFYFSLPRQKGDSSC